MPIGLQINGGILLLFSNFKEIFFTSTSEKKISILEIDLLMG